MLGTEMGPLELVRGGVLRLRHVTSPSKTRIRSFMLHFEPGPCILSFTLEFNSNKQRSFYGNSKIIARTFANTYLSTQCIRVVPCQIGAQKVCFIDIYIYWFILGTLGSSGGLKGPESQPYYPPPARRPSREAPLRTTPTRHCPSEDRCLGPGRRPLLPHYWPENQDHLHLPPLPSIAHIDIGTNRPYTVISLAATITDKMEDTKSGAICKHGAGTSIQQRGQRQSQTRRRR